MLDLDVIETSDDSFVVVVVAFVVEAVVEAAVSSVVEFDVADFVVDVETESFEDFVEEGEEEPFVDVDVAVAEADSVVEFVDSGDEITDDEGVEGGDGDESDSEKSIFLAFIDFPLGEVFEEIVDGEAVNSNELVFESGLAVEFSVVETSTSLDLAEAV